MNIPQTQFRYCPYCRKHTEHTVKRMGVGKVKSAMTQGQRRFKRKMLGYGSFPKPNPKDRAKPTRKLDLRYLCKTCKKMHTIGKGFRIKKAEFTKE